MSDGREWVERRSLGRRRTDRKWPRHLRDFWMLALTVILLLALSTINSNQNANTAALCSFKNDLQKRADSGTKFLRTHPNGFPGISAATIRVGIQNQQATLRALSPLDC